MSAFISVPHHSLPALISERLDLLQDRAGLLAMRAASDSRIAVRWIDKQLARIDRQIALSNSGLR